MAVRITFSEDGRDFQRRDWAELVDADPAGTFFHTPDYLKLYWEEFGEQPEHLLLAFAEEDDGAQVGAVAFERIETTLRFLGGTEVTDYMGPVASPGRQEAIARELWTGLPSGTTGPTPTCAASPRTAPGSGCCATRPPPTGLGVEETEDQNGVAPFLPLAATWDAYLDGLPSKLRHEIKRKAKKLEAEAGPFTIHTATEETLIPLLDRFVELHRMSEGPKGVFMQPGMEIFFRRLGEAFLPARDLPAPVHRGGRRNWPPARSASPSTARSSCTTRRSIGAGATSPRGWCSWPRTSGWRSRTAARSSTC